MKTNYRSHYIPPAQGKIIEIGRFQIEIVKPYNNHQYCLSQTEVDRVINKNGSSNLEYQLKALNLWHSELPRSLTAQKPNSRDERRRIVKICPIPIEMAFQYWILQANNGRPEAQELIAALGEEGEQQLKKLASEAFGIEAPTQDSQSALRPYSSYNIIQSDFNHQTLCQRQQEALVLALKAISYLKQINSLLTEVIETLNSDSSLNSQSIL
ncbi:MAG: hypothetical protein F6K58_08445 [Symploca sp. SIO2E9]|nr:hypothetical protein [Symploca sp. SIO2E9]